MKNILSKLFIFATGAAAGSLVTYHFVKSRCEQEANEVIKEMKEYYTHKYDGPQQSEPCEDKSEEIDSDTESKTDIAVEDYHETLVEAGYTTYNKIRKEEVEKVEKPYVIMPEEFGEIDGYETISLTLYADGVLTDDFDDPIEDVEHTVGKDSLTHFGQYEDDSVFVRNDRLKCDYEILADYRNYSAVVSSKSRVTGD